MSAAPWVAIVTDDPGWHGARLAEALARRGLAGHYVSCRELGLSVTGTGLPVTGLDGQPVAVFVRGVPGGTLEQVILRLDLLHELDARGIPVLNSGRVIERTVDKAMTSLLLARHGIPTPRTWICEDRREAWSVWRQVRADGGALVSKPLFGSQGAGIERIDSDADFHRLAGHAGVFYLQELVPSPTPAFRDTRVFVAGGEALAAMRRESTDWRTNRARGARCTALPPDPADIEPAVRATSAVGADYAGVDLVTAADGRRLVVDVNGVPAWKGLQSVTRVDIASRLADLVLARIVHRETPPRGRLTAAGDALEPPGTATAWGMASQLP